MASSWIWQQPDWPRFRWKGSALEPLLKQARAARQDLLSRLATLEAPLDREAISALLSRESLGTAAIEGELLDPGQVRSSIARRLRLRSLVVITKAGRGLAAGPSEKGKATSTMS